jgi:L-aminoadipate-semialdehyde dehydrogenase
MEQIERWKSRLEAQTELVLPTDYPRPIPMRIVEAEQAFDISQNSSLSILQVSLAIREATPFDILLAAFSILLHRYTGENDLSLGSSSLSSNPLVLRFQITKEMTFSEVVQKVLETNASAASDEIPFDVLVNAVLKASQEDDLKKSLFKGSISFF